MSDTERQSPRAAIRKWLQVTDCKTTARPYDALRGLRNTDQASGLFNSRQDHLTSHPLASQDHFHQGNSQTQHRHRKSGTRPKGATDKSALIESVQSQPRKHAKDHTVKSNSLGLAERLGLHAPFRTFKEHSDDNAPEVHRRSRKRRRARSSTSSYLEPVAVNGSSDKEHGGPILVTAPRPAKMRPALSDRGENRSPTASRGSEIISQSPEKLPQSYERRPRHKTRLDRYEFKGNDERSMKAKQVVNRDRMEKKPKKQKKHKRKEKSGAALMHDFAAQNVAHDRLTLKSSKTLGLFGKGRASSPVRRRGLPDLAFSEMTFLNSRREKPKDRFDDSFNKPLDKMKRRKLSKAADTEAEISKYFTSTKPSNLHEKASHLQRYSQDRRRSRDGESPQAVVELPDRPFLGFGSCGPNASISPAKSLVNRNSRSLHREVSRSPTRSTSYLPWSPSPEPSYASPASDRRHNIEPLQSSKLSNRKQTSLASRRDRRSVPLVTSIGVQTSSPRLRRITSKPSSMRGNAIEDPSQDRGSHLAEEERPKPRDTSQKSIDTGKLEPDTGRIPQSIEGSNPDNTHPVKAAIHNDVELGSSSRKPLAHDGRPLPAHMLVSPPNTDQLDDILEELRRGCNVGLAKRDPASHAALSNCNFRVLEKPKTSAGTQECLDIPVHGFFDSVKAPEASAVASASSRKPRSASLQLASARDDSRSKQTQSKGSMVFDDELRFSNTTDHPAVPVQYQMDSRNAWNGYDNFYESQQDEANRPKILTEHPPRGGAVRDSFLDLSRETDLRAGPRENVPVYNAVDAQYKFGDHRSHLYETLRERNGDDSYQEASHGGLYNQEINQGASDDSRVSMPGVSHADVDDGTVAIDDANEHQERERPFSQGPDEQETEHRRFTTNIMDTCSWRRSPEPPGSSYGIGAHAADDGVQGIDSTFSQFWTPHKLY